MTFCVAQVAHESFAVARPKLAFRFSVTFDPDARKRQVHVFSELATNPSDGSVHHCGIFFNKLRDELLVLKNS